MMREMFRFALILLVVMLGFTLSFHALFRTDDTTYGRTCLNLFKAMLGEVGFFDEFAEDRYENRYKSVATVLLVMYLIIITVVLLNLLIAVLTTSHDKVQEHAHQEYRVLQARLIKHYRRVVREDLLPAPFNLVQLPFRWHEGSRRCVGYLVFWLVAGPVAVVGGTLLWAVSAVFVLPQRPSRSVELRHVRWFCSGVGYVAVLFLRAMVYPPYAALHLSGLWLTRPLVVCWGSTGKIDANGSESQLTAPVAKVDVDNILAAEGEPSVTLLRTFVVDPLSDDKVREDERKKPTTVEHIKLLRDRLESTTEKQNEKLKEELEEAIQKIERKVDSLQRAVRDIMDLIQLQRDEE